jgi:hypothetical protein
MFNLIKKTLNLMLNLCGMVSNEVEVEVKRV